MYSSGYSLSISACSFDGNGKDRSAIGSLSYRSNGGGLFIEKTSKISIRSKTVFRDLRGRFGGAIYIV